MKLETLLFRFSEAERLAETDPELAHLEADRAMLEYINNPKAEEAYDKIVKGYNL